MGPASLSALNADRVSWRRETVFPQTAEGMRLLGFPRSNWGTHHAVKHGDFISQVVIITASAEPHHAMSFTWTLICVCVEQCSAVW